MERILSDKIITARKHYLCNASEQWNRSGYDIDDCETSDQKLIVEAAKADKWKILPGQSYRKISGIHDGELVTYRARCGMDSVCLDLGLFDEF